MVSWEVVRREEGTSWPLNRPITALVSRGPLRISRKSWLASVEKLRNCMWAPEKRRKEQKYFNVTYQQLQLLPCHVLTPTRFLSVESLYVCKSLFMMLTVTNWQVDSPGAVTVAGVVAREPRTQYHALHLLSDSTTLSWQRADEAFH